MSVNDDLVEKFCS